MDLTLYILIGIFSVVAQAAPPPITMGFSQIGAESAWRVANTKSIKDAAKAEGVELIFADAQQSQVNQLKAIKTFILQKVDVIAFSPVVTTGWRKVLLEAKKSKIPVIVLDREIDKKDHDLISTFIGADFREEGRRAAHCLVDALKLKKENKAGAYRVIEIRGTEGSAPAIERSKGFREVADQSGVLKIVRSEGGDFKESLGKEVMEGILDGTPKASGGFDAVFAHNDNMALGAIAALKGRGFKPGKEVVVVSVDAIREAFEAMIAGELNCTVECSPLLGTQLMTAARDIQSGKTLEKRIITRAGVFPMSSAKDELPKRQY
jgi:galactofuranose transport system substrate-binding protein